MPGESLTRSKLMDLVKQSRGITYDEILKLSSVVEKAGGQFVGFDSDDDGWCGSCGVKVPLKPGKRPELTSLFDDLMDYRINFEVIINGIPVPEELYIQLRRSNALRH